MRDFQREKEAAYAIREKTQLFIKLSFSHKNKFRRSPSIHRYQLGMVITKAKNVACIHTVIQQNSINHRRLNINGGEILAFYAILCSLSTEQVQFGPAAAFIYRTTYGRSAAN